MMAENQPLHVAADPESDDHQADDEQADDAESPARQAEKNEENALKSGEELPG